MERTKQAGAVVAVLGLLLVRLVLAGGPAFADSCYVVHTSTVPPYGEQCFQSAGDGGVQSGSGVSTSYNTDSGIMDLTTSTGASGVYTSTATEAGNLYPPNPLYEVWVTGASARYGSDARWVAGSSVTFKLYLSYTADATGATLLDQCTGTIADQGTPGSGVLDYAAGCAFGSAHPFTPATGQWFAVTSSGGWLFQNNLAWSWASATSGAGSSLGTVQIDASHSSLYLSTPNYGLNVGPNGYLQDPTIDTGSTTTTVDPSSTSTVPGDTSTTAAGATTTTTTAGATTSSYAPPTLPPWNPPSTGDPGSDGILGGLGHLLTGVAEAVNSGFQALYSALGTVISAIGGMGASVVSALGSVSSLLSTMSTAITTAIGTMASSVGTAVASGASSVGTAVGSMSTAVVSAVSGAASSISAAVSGIGDGISSAVGSIGDRITGAIGSLGDQLGAIFSGLANGVTTGISGLFTPSQGTKDSITNLLTSSPIVRMIRDLAELPSLMLGGLRSGMGSSCGADPSFSIAGRSISFGLCGAISSIPSGAASVVRNGLLALTVWDVALSVYRRITDRVDS